MYNSHIYKEDEMPQKCLLQENTVFSSLPTLPIGCFQGHASHLLP